MDHCSTKNNFLFAFLYNLSLLSIHKKRRPTKNLFSHGSSTEKTKQKQQLQTTKKLTFDEIILSSKLIAEKNQTKNGAFPEDFDKFQPFFLTNSQAD
jgi:hypothetical protein